eukprot:461434-Pelagomonas_calceolata.AAC.2
MSGKGSQQEVFRFLPDVTLNMLSELPLDMPPVTDNAIPGCAHTCGQQVQSDGLGVADQAGHPTPKVGCCVRPAHSK